MKINIVKTVIIYLVNIVIGFISAFYLFLAVSVIQNTTKGPNYYDPDGEELRWFGVVMLVFWLFLVWLINVGLGKLLRENMKEKLQLFYEKKLQWKNILCTYIPIMICITIGVQGSFFVYEMLHY